MAYRTRLRSAMLAQAAAAPPTEDDTEPSATMSDLTELPSSPPGLTHPSAVSLRASSVPAVTADAPESESDRDDHFSGGGVASAEEKSRKEESDASERRDVSLERTVESSGSVSSMNNYISAESTPVYSRKKYSPTIEDVPEEGPDTQEPSGLTIEQSRAIGLARNSMTDEERERFDRRAEHVCTVRNSENFQPSDDSVSEESLLGKGKGIDPRNWGSLDLPTAELDPQIQRQLLEAKDHKNENDAGKLTKDSVPSKKYAGEPAAVSNVCVDGETAVKSPSRKEIMQYLHDQRKLVKELNRLKQKQKTNHDKRFRSGSVPVSNELAELIGKVTKDKDRVREVLQQDKTHYNTKDSNQPISQVSGKSALGQAFRRLDGAQHGEPSDDSFSDSESDSDLRSSTDVSSSTESDGSSDEESSSDSGSSSSSGRSSVSSRSRRKGRGRNKGKKGKKTKRSRSRRRSKSRKRSKPRKTLIKPTPPSKYDGQAEYRAFQKFLTHGTAYVKYGYVEKRRQVMVLSEFLTGKAYTFYMRRVSLAPHRWTLKEFFTELFNYCFPIDYRNQQRVRLDRLERGNKSVKDYVADLDELFTIVGSDNSRSRVVKLFNGFKPSIQKALLRAHLNPERSSWKALVHEAEYQEMADNVDTGEGRDNSGPSRRDRRRNRQPEHRSDHKERNHSPKRSGSPTFGKKTNTTPGFSSKRHRRSSNFHAAQTKPGLAMSRSQNDSMVAKYSLSKDEEAELRAANKCFRCKEEGHVARNCPRAHIIKSSAGKPPGISAYGVAVDLDEDLGQLRWDSLEDTTELTVGLV